MGGLPVVLAFSLADLRKKSKLMGVESPETQAADLNGELGCQQGPAWDTWQYIP